MKKKLTISAGALLDLEEAVGVSVLSEDAFSSGKITLKTLIDVLSTSAKDSGVKGYSVTDLRKLTLPEIIATFKESMGGLEGNEEQTT